jgi:hypothetical protein
MGKRTKLSGPTFLCDLSGVRCNALIECTLSAVRESVSGMFDGMYVLLPLVPVYLFVPYRTVRWQYYV